MKLVLVILGEADLLTASGNKKTYEHPKHKNKYFSDHSFGKKACFYLEPKVGVVGVADKLASRCGAVHSLVEAPIFVYLFRVTLLPTLMVSAEMKRQVGGLPDLS